jgi:hypothetical protein
MKRIAGVGIWFGVWGLGFGICLAAQAADVSGIVARATDYVDQFQMEFGSVVSEERYQQRIRGGLGSRSTRNSGPTDTVLVSDFLLVQIPGEGWLPFRDVFERDGSKLRDREDRLATLFLKGSDRSTFDQARRIMNESARYNIGSIERNINTPTLVLQFLTPLHKYRFRFVVAGEVNGQTVVEFTETERPTFISTTGGRDLPVSGRFWAETGTGVVTKTELDAVDATVTAHIAVTYRRDEALGMLVPARMEERYNRPGDSAQITGTATYSRFRRFQVTTSEDVGAPADSPPGR